MATTTHSTLHYAKEAAKEARANGYKNISIKRVKPASGLGTRFRVYYYR